MSNDRITVKPDYSSSDYDSSTRLLGKKDAVQYPIHIERHRVQVRHEFEKQSTGFKQVGIGFACERCDSGGYVEYSHLHQEDGEHIRQIRAYLLGSILEADCV